VSPVKYELGFYIPEDGILHPVRIDGYEFVKLEVFTVVIMKCRLLGCYTVWLL
jgi:hypothetical protein